jgi:replicative DNA helicase
MKLSAPIFQLKRRAKSMSRERKIPLAEALNRVAEKEGFRTWSLLAARYAKGDLVAPAILASFEPGDMVLIGARPMHGKTRLALKILAEARRAGRFCAYFTLEHTSTEAAEILRSYGLDAQSTDVFFDASDAICADYMMAKLAGVRAGSVIAVDYLQALDHQREKPPLAEQVSALKAFGQHAKLIFVFISQIDRHYDAAAKALPDLTDVRMPNRIDTGLFNKTCFLHNGELVFDGARPPVV